MERNLATEFFKTLPPSIKFFEANELSKDPTYSPILTFLNQDISTEKWVDMNGAGRTRIWTPEKGGFFIQDYEFKTPHHRDHHEDKWTVIRINTGRGSIQFSLDGKEKAVTEGKVIIIPQNTPMLLKSADKLSIRTLVVEA